MASEGFVKASSNNLPYISIFMITEFIKNDDRFNAAEFKGVKAATVSRQAYGDSAVGYVEVKREDTVCTLQGRICPEHRVKSKPYHVCLIVDEQEEQVINVCCNDCPASSGGCKHALAFLMWAHRRSEDPSTTEVTCYWKKTPLAGVGTSQKFIKAEDFSKMKSNELLLDNSTFREDLLSIVKDNNISGKIVEYNEDTPSKFDNLSIYKLLLQFGSCSDDLSFSNFVTYVEEMVSENLCDKVEKFTCKQSASPLWHEMRFARITASKCKTAEGTLVESIIGAYKVSDRSAMKRGRNLEKHVIKVVGEKLNIKVKKCGLFILPTYPFFGASPDGITSQHIIEVKCPSSAKAVQNYVKNNEPTAKFKAQVHLQMFCANSQKGLFCVADPEFEKNNNVQIVEVIYDENYLKQIMFDSLQNWENINFPKLCKSVLI